MGKPYAGRWTCLQVAAVLIVMLLLSPLDSASMASAAMPPAAEPATILPPPLPEGGTDPVQSTPSSGDLAAMLASGASLITCGASGNLYWYTTSSSAKVVLQCSFSVPEAGWVFVSANSTVARFNGPYEAVFRIGIDTTNPLGIIREVDVHDDTGDGTDKSVAMSVLEPVAPGRHTFYFLAERFSGSGSVFLEDPSLTVIFIPAAGSQVLACGAQTYSWTTTSNTLQAINQCSLSVPQAGWVFISADSQLLLDDDPYDAWFEIDIDSTSGDWNIDRWVNIYDESGVGGAESVALTVLQPVAAGAHTFYSLGARFAGTGTMLLFDATLTVIFVPSAASQVRTCGSSGDLSWTTNANTFQVIRQCTLTVPRPGWAFISADGSVARLGGEYEALFEIGIDSTNAWDIDRYINIYNDADYGTDRSVALSMLVPLTAGTHTFYFLGRRSVGTGTVLVYDPTISVIAGVRLNYLPVILRRHSGGME